MFKKLSLVVLGFLLVYPLALSLIQYRVWKGNEFTQILLTMPLSSEVELPVWLMPIQFVFDGKLGYFLFYSYGRFFVPSFISILAGFGLYWCLRLLRGFLRRGISNEELWLICFAALAVGWPRFIVFVPLLFVFLLLEAFANARKAESRIPMDRVVWLAAAATLLFGRDILLLLSFSVLYP